jgi:hypothetical protein
MRLNWTAFSLRLIQLVDSIRFYLGEVILEPSCRISANLDLPSSKTIQKGGSNAPLSSLTRRYIRSLVNTTQ